MPIQRHVENTGIWTRETVRVTGRDLEPVLREWAKKHNELVHNWPERIERALCGIRPDSPIEVLRGIVGDEVFSKMPEDVREAALRDAKTAAAIVRFLKARFRDSDEQEAVRLGVLLGAVLERLGVRPFEADARRGRKIVEAARQGHRRRYGSAEARARRAAQYRAEVAAIRKKNDVISNWGACELVASRYDISTKTVWRATRQK